MRTTPGPWISRHGQIVQDDGGAFNSPVVAEAFKPGDAALIAAAPAMRDMLRRIVEADAASIAELSAMGICLQPAPLPIEAAALMVMIDLEVGDRGP